MPCSQLSLQYRGPINFKSMKYRYNCFFIIIVALSACKKEVNQKITAVDPQLVVQSFISPSDDSMKVDLSYSTNYFGDAPSRNNLNNNIFKAEVIIGDGAFSKTLKWSRRAKGFTLATADFPLSENKTYYLKVKTFEGLKVEASTTIPVSFNEIEFSKVSSSLNNDQVKDRITMSIKDEKGEINYYRFKLLAYFDYSEPAITDEYYGIGDQLLNDNDDAIGTIFTNFSNERNKNFNGNYGGTGVTVKSYYKGFFIKGTKEYYKYLESSKNNNNASGNPFAESISVYSNVKGGLGVFAAYQIIEKKIPLN